MHEIEIVQLDKIEPHPDPEVERMEVTHVWGWQCCVGKNQFKSGDKAIYIPPDYMVDTSKEYFKFLNPLPKYDSKVWKRIKAKRLRGTISQGLIIKVPTDLDYLPVGTNVIDQLNIKRYEPPIESAGDKFTGAPSGLYCPKFDVENWQRWHNTFKEGEPVHVTEKMHGTSSRYTYAKNKKGESIQFCGTRNNWVKEGGNDLYWRAFNQCPAIGAWCQANPGQILYGEVFGMVKKHKYGAENDTIFFAAFGILNQNTWLNFNEARLSANEHEVPWCPLLYSGPFDIEKIKELAEGDSSWVGASHMREGVVVLPHEERTDPEIGRVQLKIVSNRYLEKGK